MITDEMIEKAALAGINAVRAYHKCDPIDSLGYRPDLSRHEYRAALEAVAADIRNAALEEAKQLVSSCCCTWETSIAIEALKTKVTP